MSARILSAVFFLSMVLNNAGCAARSAAMHENSTPRTNVKLTSDDLEGIRQATIAHYESTKNEFRNAFIPELQRGAIFLDDDMGPAIGIWKVIPTDAGFDLARTPPLPPETPKGQPPLFMITFGVHFAKRDGTWMVTGDFEQHDIIKPR
jgi:hypothetical protein